MEKELSGKSFKRLVQAFLLLENEKECLAFLRDVCTLTELHAMAERLEVAELVMQNIPYRKISEVTGASTATITRVAHWLKNGEGGYTKILKKLEK